MARYRFPGRPGHKVGRSGAVFTSEEARNFHDPTSIYAGSIQRGLKRFRELVGESDEEEEFVGFSAEEVGIKAYRRTSTRGTRRQSSEPIPSLPLSSETLQHGSCITTRLSHARLSLEALPASERTRSRLKTLIRKSYKDLKKEESNEFRTTTHVIKRVKEIEGRVAARSPTRGNAKTKQKTVSLVPKLKKLKIRLFSDGREGKIVRGPGRPTIYERSASEKEQAVGDISPEKTEPKAVVGPRKGIARRVRVLPATKKADTKVVQQILQKAKGGRPRKYAKPVSPPIAPNIRSQRDRTGSSSTVAKTRTYSKLQSSLSKTNESLSALSNFSESQTTEVDDCKSQTRVARGTKSAKMLAKSQLGQEKSIRPGGKNEILEKSDNKSRTCKDTVAKPAVKTVKGKVKAEKLDGDALEKGKLANSSDRATTQDSTAEVSSVRVTTFKGARKFVLPMVSARSSRVIKPNKRLFEDNSLPTISAKLPRLDVTTTVAGASKQAVDGGTDASKADKTQQPLASSETTPTLYDARRGAKGDVQSSRPRYKKSVLAPIGRRKEKSPEKKKTEEIAAKLTKKARQDIAKKSVELQKAAAPSAAGSGELGTEAQQEAAVEKEIKQEQLMDVENYEGNVSGDRVPETVVTDDAGVKEEPVERPASSSQVVTPERRSKRKVLLKSSVAKLLGRDRKPKADDATTEASSRSKTAAVAKKGGKPGSRRPSELVKKAKLQLHKAALSKAVKQAEAVKKDQLVKLNMQLEMEQKRVHSPVDLKSFPVVNLESLVDMNSSDNATQATHTESPEFLQTANMSQPEVKENQPTGASPIQDDDADTSDNVSTTSSNSTRGPRIKHVCRRAAVVLGQSRALFGDDNHELRLSALPEREKEKLREKKEEKPVVSDDETPQLSPKKENKTIPKRETKTVPKEDTPAKPRKRRRRCGECEGCQRVADCRKCEYCLDKTKYGGPNVKKQCCIHKKCKAPIPALGAPEIVPKAPRPKRERVPPSKLQKRKKEERPNTSVSAVPGSSVAARPKTAPGITNGNLIRIEYKQEDYEVESVWDYGMPIISTMPLVTRTVCFLCASTGKHELVYCNVCCEPFHEFCLEDDEKPLEGHSDTWCCRRCKFCHVCGRQQNLLQCDKCHHTYHAECLGPNYPTKPTKRKKVWICTKCVRCKSCGATTPGQSFNAQWSHDFSLCQDCGKLFDKGNYCPLCQQCYTDDDYESKMMQCASCESWVHSKCEGLTDEMYQIMCELPEDIHYTCSRCKPEKPAQWQIDIKEEMQAGFQLVLGQLLATKSIEQLFRKRDKKEDLKDSPKSEKLSRSEKVEKDRTVSPFSKALGEIQSEQPMAVDDTIEQVQNANEVHDVTDEEQASEPLANQTQCCEPATQGEDTKETETPQESLGDVEVTNQGPADPLADEPTKESEIDNIEFETSDGLLRLESLFPEPDTRTSESTDSAPSETSEVTARLERSDESAGRIICRRKGLTIGRISLIGPPKKDHADGLLDMRDRMNEGKYISVSGFNDDIVRIIQESISSEKDENSSLKRMNRVAKNIFIRQMEKVFPWFSVHASSFWEHNKNLPDGMLPNAVLPPHPDHEYAQWREKYPTDPTTPQPSPLKKLPPTPNKLMPDDGVFDLPMDTAGEDTRRCCLCGHFGDDEPNDAGRLLYCGQDEWIHINCALWSAEVFEEVDGSLINVHPAVTRGRQMRCEHCNRFGATVGCCMRGCPANFHFMCARTELAVFQEDKKVFCYAHRNKVDHELVDDDNFAVKRRVCVNMEGMKLKKELVKGWDPRSINVLTGAMTVEYLGVLSSLSDTKAALFPIDFKVTRVYWSTVDTRRRCIYTISIKEYKPLKPVTQIQDMNRTVVHNATLPSGIDDINYTIPHESNPSPADDLPIVAGAGCVAADGVTGIMELPPNVEMESERQGEFIMEVDDAVALATEYLTQADSESNDITESQNLTLGETDSNLTQSTDGEILDKSVPVSTDSVAGLAPSTLKMLPAARIKNLSSKSGIDVTASPNYTASPRTLGMIAERLNTGAGKAKCAKEINFSGDAPGKLDSAEISGDRNSLATPEQNVFMPIESLQQEGKTEFQENCEILDTDPENLDHNEESGLVLDIADSDLQLSDSALELMALNSDNLSVANSIPVVGSTTASTSGSIPPVDENSALQIAEIEQELEEVESSVMHDNGKNGDGTEETIETILTQEEVGALVQEPIEEVSTLGEEPIGTEDTMEATLTHEEASALVQEPIDEVGPLVQEPTEEVSAPVQEPIGTEETMEAILTQEVSTLVQEPTEEVSAPVQEPTTSVISTSECSTTEVAANEIETPNSSDSAPACQVSNDGNIHGNPEGALEYFSAAVTDGSSTPVDQIKDLQHEDKRSDSEAILRSDEIATAGSVSGICEAGGSNSPTPDTGNIGLEPTADIVPGTLDQGEMECGTGSVEIQSGLLVGKAVDGTTVSEESLPLIKSLLQDETSDNGQQSSDVSQQDSLLMLAPPAAEGTGEELKESQADSTTENDHCDLVSQKDDDGMISETEKLPTDEAVKHDNEEGSLDDGVSGSLGEDAESDSISMATRHPDKEDTTDEAKASSESYSEERVGAEESHKVSEEKNECTSNDADKVTKQPSRDEEDEQAEEFQCPSFLCHYCGKGYKLKGHFTKHQRLCSEERRKDGKDDKFEKDLDIIDVSVHGKKRYPMRSTKTRLMRIVDYGTPTLPKPNKSPGKEEMVSPTQKRGRKKSFGSADSIVHEKITEEEERVDESLVGQESSERSEECEEGRVSCRKNDGQVQTRTRSRRSSACEKSNINDEKRIEEVRNGRSRRKTSVDLSGSQEKSRKASVDLSDHNEKPRRGSVDQGVSQVKSRRSSLDPSGSQDNSVGGSQDSSSVDKAQSDGVFLTNDMSKIAAMKEMNPVVVLNKCDELKNAGQDSPPAAGEEESAASTSKNTENPTESDKSRPDKICANDVAQEKSMHDVRSVTPKGLSDEKAETGLKTPSRSPSSMPEPPTSPVDHVPVGLKLQSLLLSPEKVLPTQYTTSPEEKTCHQKDEFPTTSPKGKPENKTIPNKPPTPSVELRSGDPVQGGSVKATKAHEDLSLSELLRETTPVTTPKDNPPKNSSESKSKPSSYFVHGKLSKIGDQHVVVITLPDGSSKTAALPKGIVVSTAMTNTSSAGYTFSMGDLIEHTLQKEINVYNQGNKTQADKKKPAGQVWQESVKHDHQEQGKLSGSSSAEKESQQPGASSSQKQQTAKLHQPKLSPFAQQRDASFPQQQKIITVHQQTLQGNAAQKANVLQKSQMHTQAVEVKQQVVQPTFSVAQQRDVTAELLQHQQALAILQQHPVQLQKQGYQSQQLLQGLPQPQPVANYQQHSQNQAQLQQSQALIDPSTVIGVPNSVSPTRSSGPNRMKSPQPPVAILPKRASDPSPGQDKQDRQVMMSVVSNPQQQMVIMAANAVQAANVPRAVNIRDNSSVNKVVPAESRTPQKITTRVNDGVGSIEVQNVPVINPQATPYMVVNNKGVPVLLYNNQDTPTPVEDTLLVGQQLPSVSQTHTVAQSPVKVIVDMKSHNSATVVQQQLQPQLHINSTYALGKGAGLSLQSQGCANLVPQPCSQVQTLNIPGMAPVHNSISFGGFQPPVVPTSSSHKPIVSAHITHSNVPGTANISPLKQSPTVPQNSVYSPLKSFLQSTPTSSNSFGNTVFQSTDFGAPLIVQNNLQTNMGQGVNTVGAQLPQQYNPSKSSLSINPITQVPGGGMQVQVQGTPNFNLIQDMAANLYSTSGKQNVVSDILLQPGLNSEFLTQQQLAGNNAPHSNALTIKGNVIQQNQAGLPMTNPTLEQLIQGLSPQKSTNKMPTADAITQEVWQDLLKVMQPTATVSRAQTTPNILRNKSPVTSAYLTIPGTVSNLTSIPNSVTIAQVSLTQDPHATAKHSVQFSSIPSTITTTSQLLAANGILTTGTSNSLTTCTMPTNGVPVMAGTGLTDEHQIAKNTSSIGLSDAARQAMMSFRCNTAQEHSTNPTMITSQTAQTAVPNLVGVGLRQISPSVQNTGLNSLLAQQNLQYSADLAKVSVTTSSGLGASAALRSIVQQNQLHGTFLSPASLLPPLPQTSATQQFTGFQSNTATVAAVDGKPQTTPQEIPASLGGRRPAKPDQITQLTSILSAAGLDSLSNLSPAELASLHQALVTQSAIDLDLVSAKLFGTPPAKKRRQQPGAKRARKTKSPKTNQRSHSVWMGSNMVMPGAVCRDLTIREESEPSIEETVNKATPGPSQTKPKPRIKNPGSSSASNRPRMKHPTFQSDEFAPPTFNPANSSWEKAVEERLKNADLSVYSLLREPPMMKDQSTSESGAEVAKGRKKRKRKEKLQAKSDDSTCTEEGAPTKPKRLKPKHRRRESYIDLTRFMEEDKENDDEDDDQAGSFLMKVMEQEEKRKQKESPKNKDEPHLVFEVTSDDGFHTEADTITEAWQKVLEKVQETRNSQGMKYLSFAGVDGLRMIGVTHDAVVYLLEQLYGAKNCRKYKFKFHQYESSQDFIDEEPPINPHGCARTECYTRRSKFDMFNFLASKHRKLAIHTDNLDEEEEIQHKSARRATSMDLPMAMRFRHLERTSREAVGVYRSRIHGRGLFCKRPIDAGEMVIEYSGMVIRSVLTDKREKYYDSKGIGCYMFRIDDYDVVDATMHGNAARFINHSCEPNCFSRVIQVDGKKHIVIFASRKIMPGEELTYDYKFPFEEEKIPCSCGSKKCRKHLN